MALVVRHRSVELAFPVVREILSLLGLGTSLDQVVLKNFVGWVIEVARSVYRSTSKGVVAVNVSLLQIEVTVFRR